MTLTNTSNTHFALNRLAPMVVALGASALAAIPAASNAQSGGFPNRPIRMVVTFPPGGAPDILARAIGVKMQESWGQSVVVENRPGAGGNIGTDVVAKSTADGYTLVMGTVGTHAINASLYAKMPFDPIKDFAPVILVASTPNLLVVNNDVPAKSVAELIALAKKKPGQLAYGSPGIGTSVHVSGELFSTMAGIRMVHVPYKGRAMAIPDLLGGQIQLMFDNMPSALPVVRDGKLRALAVTSAKRSPAAPDIPTLAELGLTGFEATSWFAIYAPAGSPADVVTRLNVETNRILGLPDVRPRLTGIGLEVIGGSPQDLADHTRREVAKWAKVVKDAGAKAD